MSERVFPQSQMDVAMHWCINSCKARNPEAQFIEHFLTEAERARRLGNGEIRHERERMRSGLA